MNYITISLNILLNFILLNIWVFNYKDYYIMIILTSIFFGIDIIKAKILYNNSDNNLFIITIISFIICCIISVSLFIYILVVRENVPLGIFIYYFTQGSIPLIILIVWLIYLLIKCIINCSEIIKKSYHESKLEFNNLENINTDI